MYRYIELVLCNVHVDYACNKGSTDKHTEQVFHFTKELHVKLCNIHTIHMHRSLNFYITY